MKTHKRRLIHHSKVIGWKVKFSRRVFVAILDLCRLRVWP